MHYVQTCRLWVGWGFLSWGSVLWAVFGGAGCVLAARMRGAGMRKPGPCCQRSLLGSSREQTGRGKKPLCLWHIPFWPYGMCCSWSFPGRGKKFFSSTFSSLVRTFPLSLKFFRSFSVELDMENIANVIYPFLQTVKLAVQGACEKNTLF